MSSSADTRVVVAIDFGTTYSGFAYAHKSNPGEIIVQDYWKDFSGYFKTPTVIKYDDSYTMVESWGLPALAKKPISRRQPLQPSSKPIELFKLHLLGRSLRDKDKPTLPDGLDYKRVIKDYLEKLRFDVEKNVKNHWSTLDFYKQVAIVMTVPAEFNDNAISIMRECAFEAGLIREKDSENLTFTTEPEAAAIHYISSLEREYHLNPGDSFMVVDCGGGTVDLTVRELLDDNQLVEITERKGDCCGSSYIDKAFIEFLGNKMGKSTIDTLKKDYYRYLQYMVQEFCKNVKFRFTGKEEDFDYSGIDLDDYGTMKLCVEGEEKDQLERDEWLINIDFNDVKGMFDPVIERIIVLVKDQLLQSRQREKKVSLMLLVGGFSESEYLQTRIRQEFSSVVPNISVPLRPIIAVMKGAVKFGLSEKTIKNRVLKWSYGTDILRRWRSIDPLPQRLPNGYIKVFEKLAERGKSIRLNEEVTKRFKPYSSIQDKIYMDMYVTPSFDVEYFDDPEMNLLRKWEINLDSYEDDVTFLLTLKFGHVEILATAVNEKTGVTKEVTFKYDLD
ncbi:13090_t:CDS:2 [Acaulospora morrowiae]|uniref:13090_t:CDS:1 n=1 Tax=Acaulospora morrowiae TaxID=94023 RepID=A0A9N9FR46_9GLOM|nr:13090_t:CDS:2 [Acaulospora morrowiae]